MRTSLSVLATAVALTLGGCLDWVVPGDYAERGYDGATDPLTQQDQAELATILDERFKLIQTR